MPRAFLLPSRRHHRPVKPALHRSLTFWSGILAMAFIGWAWQDSMSYETSIGGFIAGRAVGSWSGEGEIALSRVDGVNSLRRTVVMDVHRNPKVGQRLLPSPRYLVEGAPPFIRRVFFPYWLMLLAVALPWLGLLAWRARRRKRIITEP